MKLSSKSIHAIKLFIDLSERRAEGFVSLSSIGERKGISKKYLEQIVALFKIGGLLDQARGKNGGYALSKDPKDIKISDILMVTEDFFRESLTGYSPVDLFTKEFDKATFAYLSKITLADLTKMQIDEYSNSYMI